MTDIPPKAARIRERRLQREQAARRRLAEECDQRYWDFLGEMTYDPRRPSLWDSLKELFR